ncbi:thymidylate kinase [Actinoalloteichus caeruleus]|uniref:Thymidylate kinase n=1 Tax=Actinoalloteichus caeruleus DSM 43889 TaxID=1120930 RepID=A0ABT1JCE0_ACTCY|nr:thymidylate kinase [Actinoalloteichus caeruleus]MCP2330160.1 Thymidylate kinase [Actinoalloteichus caeruleus DSM 43889]
MIIAVVGSDGAGKSTVTSLAVDRLVEAGEPAQLVERWRIVDNPDYPATRFLRPPVSDLRLCVAEMPNPPRFLFLMWSIGMALLGERSQPPAGDEAVDEAVGVLDGYWMKHAASEIVYGMDRGWVESVVAGLPVPDLVLYLRLEPEAAWRRKEHDLVPYECGMDPDCGRDNFLRHQGAILSLLDEWSARHGWVEVDATLPLDTVVDRVVTAVRSARATGSAKAVDAVR